jgi:hypothetical protein
MATMSNTCFMTGVHERQVTATTTVEREPDGETDAEAIERMLDDGSPVPRYRRRARTASHVQLSDEPSAEERAAQRRAARRRFRLYCFACGRSTESATAPFRVGRCQDCGGSMMVELAAD